jgi:formylglycine-generating enzyme required for sulfatase activity
MQLKNLSIILLAGALLVSTVVSQAVTIDLVPVGNAGNAPDTRYIGISVGAVNYSYDIGKYEITAGQYTAFLNAVAATDTYGLYNQYMNYDTYPLYRGCNIKRIGTSGSYTYSVASDWANRPVNWVSFWDACRFVNWLNNGQSSGDTETGSYTLNGYNGADGRTISKNAGAKWWIPSEDEWYKAAYHKNDGVTGNYWDYPTGTNNMPSNVLSNPNPDPGNNANFNANGYTIGSPYYRTPVGDFENSASPYGTLDQGGNVWEWNDTVVSQGSGYSLRGMRGGSAIFNSSSLLASNRMQNVPTDEAYNDFLLGFRVVYVPEPSSIILLISGFIGLLIRKLHRNGF